jgi:Fur family zinc uptake transcriptional regulator
MGKCNNHKKCLTNLEEKIAKTCNERGLKFTDLRREVFTIISKNHGMIKAYDILAKMREKNSLTEPPTVYRALDFLIENNFIHKINSLNSYVTCYHLVDDGFCFFLICSKCGIVEENLDSRFSDLIISAVKKHKFLLQKSSLEIEGTCKNCS